MAGADGSGGRHHDCRRCHRLRLPRFRGAFGMRRSRKTGCRTVKIRIFMERRVSESVCAFLYLRTFYLPLTVNPLPRRGQRHLHAFLRHRHRSGSPADRLSFGTDRHRPQFCRYRRLSRRRPRLRPLLRPLLSHPKRPLRRSRKRGPDCLRPEVRGNYSEK